MCLALCVAVVSLVDPLGDCDSGVLVAWLGVGYYRPDAHSWSFALSCRGAANLPVDGCGVVV